MFGRATIRLGIGPHSSFVCWLKLHGADSKWKNSNYNVLYSMLHIRFCVYRQKSMMMPEKTVHVTYQITAVML